MKTKKYLLLLIVVIFSLLVFIERGEIIKIYFKKNYSNDDLLVNRENIKVDEGKDSLGNFSEKESYRSENKSSAFATLNKSLKKEEIVKPENLRLIGICSGKFFDVFSVSEGVSKCLNKEISYSAEIEIKEKEVFVKLLENGGFEEVYDINDTVTIFYLFAEDVFKVNQNIEKFEVDGGDAFNLGNYTLYTVWRQDNFGNYEIEKMIVALPLEVKTQFLEAKSYYLKIYMTALNKRFYLGEVKINVKKEK